MGQREDGGGESTPDLALVFHDLASSINFKDGLVSLRKPTIRHPTLAPNFGTGSKSLTIASPVRRGTLFKPSPRCRYLYLGFNAPEIHRIAAPPVPAVYRRRGHALQQEWCLPVHDWAAVPPEQRRGWLQLFRLGQSMAQIRILGLAGPFPPLELKRVRCRPDAASGWQIVFQPLPEADANLTQRGLVLLQKGIHRQTRWFPWPT